MLIYSKAIIRSAEVSHNSAESDNSSNTSLDKFEDNLSDIEDAGF